MSIMDFSIPAGEAGCQTNDPRYQSSAKRPSWTEMTTHNKRFHVIFDMLYDLRAAPKHGINIPKSMSRIAQYRYCVWINGLRRFAVCIVSMPSLLFIFIVWVTCGKIARLFQRSMAIFKIRMRIFRFLLQILVR